MDETQKLILFTYNIQIRNRLLFNYTYKCKLFLKQIISIYIFIYIFNEHYLNFTFIYDKIFATNFINTICIKKNNILI